MPPQRAGRHASNAVVEVGSTGSSAAMEEVEEALREVGKEVDRSTAAGARLETGATKRAKSDASQNKKGKGRHNEQMLFVLKKAPVFSRTTTEEDQVSGERLKKVAEEIGQARNEDEQTHAKHAFIAAWLAHRYRLTDDATKMVSKDQITKDYDEACNLLKVSKLIPLELHKVVKKEWDAVPFRKLGGRHDWREFYIGVLPLDSPYASEASIDMPEPGVALPPPPVVKAVPQPTKKPPNRNRGLNGSFWTIMATENRRDSVSARKKRRASSASTSKDKEAAGEDEIVAMPSPQASKAKDKGKEVEPAVPGDPEPGAEADVDESMMDERPARNGKRVTRKRNAHFLYGDGDGDDDGSELDDWTRDVEDSDADEEDSSEGESGDPDFDVDSDGPRRRKSGPAPSTSLEQNEPPPEKKRRGRPPKNRAAAAQNGQQRQFQQSQLQPLPSSAFDPIPFDMLATNNNGYYLNPPHPLLIPPPQNNALPFNFVTGMPRQSLSATQPAPSHVSPPEPLAPTIEATPAPVIAPVPNSSKRQWTEFLTALDESLVSALAPVLSSQALSVTPASFFNEPIELREELLKTILARSDVPRWPAMVFARRVKEKGDSVWQSVSSALSLSNGNDKTMEDVSTT